MSDFTGDVELADFCLELQVTGRAERTVGQRRRQVRQWLRWLRVRGVSPWAASRRDVVAFLATFGPAETVASYRAAVRLWHQWCVDVGLRADDPTVRLAPVRRDEPDPNPIPDVLVLEALAGASEHDRRAILLGRFAGLRAAEIAGAHRGYLRRGDGGRPVVRVRGKGDRWRELPAHPLVVEVLRSGQGRPGWVLPSPVRPGRPVAANTVTVRLTRILPDGHTAHDLRAAFATEVYRRTGSLSAAQAWLGHQSPATTLHYVRPVHDWALMDSLALAG